MTTEPGKHIDGARKVVLCHSLVDQLKDHGLTPFESVDILLSAAASVALIASSSERADFERLAGDIFTHFANANDDVRGRR
jgi:hypothetical protein